MHVLMSTIAFFEQANVERLHIPKRKKGDSTYRKRKVRGNPQKTLQYREKNNNIFFFFFCVSRAYNINQSVAIYFSIEDRHHVQFEIFARELWGPV